MADMRQESDSLGVVEVPADRLWGAQTQRSLEHFSIGTGSDPARDDHRLCHLEEGRRRMPTMPASGSTTEHHKLITQACDEILAGQHHDMFPLHVWMTGSGTQFNMNVNEVISNRCCQIAGTPLGSKTPVHPNDHVNMAQSSNDSFPSAMYIAAAVNVKQRLVPAVAALHDAIAAKARGVERHRQDWPHPHAGRDAPDIGPGMVRLCRDAGGRSRAHRGGVARRLPAGARRHRGRHRHQFGAGLRRSGRGRDRHTDRTAVRHRAEQVHRAGRARRAGAIFGHAAHARRVALQDRQRYPPDVMRAARRLRRIDHPGE